MSSHSDEAPSSSQEADEFIVTKVDDDNGIYLCRERHYKSWNVANIWVVQGSTMDLVIDTGIGLWDLPAFLKQRKLVGDGDNQKPYLAVATHVHFDHAGGLHQFEDTAIHENEVEAIRNGNSFEACCFISRSECGKPPRKDWSPPDLKLTPANPTRILKDGDVIDLGNKKIKVVHLPGHTQGSIVLFDEANGHLFSGDVVYDGILLDFTPTSNIEDYILSMEKLERMVPRIRRVFPGHDDAFGGTKLNEIITNYLASVGTCHTIGSTVSKQVLSIFLRGRNTDNPAAKCCYYSLCCCTCQYL